MAELAVCKVHGCLSLKDLSVFKGGVKVEQAAVVVKTKQMCNSKRKV